MAQDIIAVRPGLTAEYMFTDEISLRGVDDYGRAFIICLKRREVEQLIVLSNSGDPKPAPRGQTLVI